VDAKIISCFETRTILDLHKYQILDLHKYQNGNNARLPVLVLQHDVKWSRNTGTAADVMPVFADDATIFRNIQKYSEILA